MITGDDIYLNEKPGGPATLEISGTVTCNLDNLELEEGGVSTAVIGGDASVNIDDLMVGEVYEGRMRIFNNIGSNKKFKLSEYTWFKCGADLGRIPSG